MTPSARSLKYHVGLAMVTLFTFVLCVLLLSGMVWGVWFILTLILS